MSISKNLVILMIIWAAFAKQVDDLPEMQERFTNSRKHLSDENLSCQELLKIYDVAAARYGHCSDSSQCGYEMQKLYARDLHRAKKAYESKCGKIPTNS